MDEACDNLTETTMYNVTPLVKKDPCAFAQGEERES